MRGVVFPEQTLSHIFEPHDTYLLYPGKNSHNCESVTLSKSSLVVVIDGTWDEAAKIVWRNPILQNLPRISFERPLTSTYRIRKPPREGYLSTVESVAHLLTLNAVCSGHSHMIQTYQGLFHLFNEMVSRQLAHIEGGAARRI